MVLAVPLVWYPLYYLDGMLQDCPAPLGNGLASQGDDVASQGGGAGVITVAGECHSI